MTQLLRALSPEILLIALASAMYLAGTFAKAASRRWFWAAVAGIGFAALTLLTCAATASAPPVEAGSSAAKFVSVVPLDRVAIFGKLLALVAGLALVLLSEPSSDGDHAPEYFASLLLVIAGTMLVAGANELVLLFLGLELISIPTYVMLYLARHDAAGQESSAKYFFLSIFSSAVFLYGLSFVYGAVGSTNLQDIAQSTAAEADAGTPPTLVVAVVLIMAGLGFKVAAFPFHFYAPDVYQGTTNTLAAVLAWAPKAAGFLAMLRAVSFAMPDLDGPTARLAWVLAAATMTVGNVLGLLQNNLRRLLAYSSIAHAGTMLIGIGVGNTGASQFITATGVDGVVFYLLAYAAMTLGVFAVLIYLSNPERPVETVDDLAGLAKSRPFVALAMAVFLFSLTGIPITAGFWGKLAIFASAISRALTSHEPRYTWLAVIGVVNAAISSYYYLRIIGVMYMQESYTPVAPRAGRPALAVVWGCTLVTLGVGLVPGPFLKWTARDRPAAVQAAVQPLSQERAARGD